MPKGKSKEDIWTNISSEIKEEKTSIPIVRYLSIAASLILVASLVFYFNQEATPPSILSYETTNAESTNIDLPDGSVVVLNANSSISYSEKWDRNIQLSGEAFFEVSKGEQFTVFTNVGSVEVLGTSFNVFARDSIFEVSCKEGKVLVEIPHKSFSQAIDPGDLIRLESDTVKQETLTLELIGKWQAGEFYFSDQKLSSVVMELERQFDVTIELTDSTDYIFSGYFTNKSIEGALEMVCLPLGLEFAQVNNSRYTISESSE